MRPTIPVLLLLIAGCITDIGFSQSDLRLAYVPECDRVSLQTAIDTLPAEGGRVEIPASCSELRLGSTSVNLRSNLTLSCESKETVIYSTSRMPTLKGDGLENVSVRGCSFVVDDDSGSNYHAVVSVYNSYGVSVSDCAFSMVHEPVPHQTQMAILTVGSSKVSVVNNRSKYMQFVLGGGYGLEVETDILARDNSFERPYNHAISVVNFGDNGGFRNVRLTGNTVVDVPSEGAFFLGPDGERFNIAELSNVTIANNTFSGLWRTGANSTPGAIGVIIGTGRVSHNWRIVDNTFTVQPETTDGLLADAAIRVKNDHGHTLTNLRIANNHISGIGDAPAFDQGSLWVGLSESSDIYIENNFLGGGRGLQVRGYGPGISRFEVRGNTIQSRWHGFRILQVPDHSMDATVTGNTISATGAFCSAISRILYSPAQFYARYTLNVLSATGLGGTPWGGDSSSDNEVCTSNLPYDCL